MPLEKICSQKIGLLCSICKISRLLFCLMKLTVPIKLAKIHTSPILVNTPVVVINMEDSSRPSFRCGGGERRLEIVSGRGQNSYIGTTSRPDSPPIQRPSAAAKPWGFGDSEMKRRKRIARYKVYTVEGVQRLQYLKSLGSRRDIGGVSASRMAWSIEKCDGSTMGLVRPATEDHAEEAIEAVRAGEVIAVPTDTLYGFACDACSMEAVHRIYEIKGRKHTSPLAICVADVQDIQRFATTSHLPQGLLDSLLPGPVTVVLRRGDSSLLEKSLNPGLDSIGVRVPDCDFIRSIARGSNSALALTSANLSGQPSSVDVKDFENLWQNCAYIYNGGVLPSGRAGSTVVDLTTQGKYKILRPGSAEEETVAILSRYSLVEDSIVA